MGKFLKRVEGCVIVAAASAAGLIGVCAGEVGGSVLYDNVRYVMGKAPHRIYREGIIIKRYTDENPYNGKKTRIKFDRKTQKWVATKRQPKKYMTAPKPKKATVNKTKKTK